MSAHTEVVMAEVRRRMDMPRDDRQLGCNVPTTGKRRCGFNPATAEHFITHGMLMAVAIIEGKYRDGRWIN